METSSNLERVILSELETLETSCVENNRINSSDWMNRSVKRSPLCSGLLRDTNVRVGETERRKRRRE